MTSSINAKQSMESRLLALETSLGLLQPTNSNSNSNSINKNNTKDLTSRLDALEHKFQSFSTPLTIWRESDALLQELHPQAGLTYQEPSTRNDPILYRRQQVLASADDLKRDFAQLNTIMNLLLIAQSTKKLSEEHVINAPIITSTTGSSALVDPNSTARLETLRLDIAITCQQTMAMTNRVDSLIQTYHAIVTALSERMLLLNQTFAQTIATKEH
jgi:hypothetical protein